MTTFRINAATDAGSHVGTACAGYLGEEVLLKVDPMQLAVLSTGQKVNLGYFFVSGLTPDGLSSSSTYSLDSLIEE